MKELTLINRYHQTQEHPKPPVEQRVKVMDTLDKKMQAIRPIVHSIFERLRRLQTQTRGSRKWTRETGTDRRRNFGKCTKNNEGQGTTLVEIQGRNRSRKQRGGCSQRRTAQKEIFQPTRMGNIRRGLTRSKCSTIFDWSRGPLEIHHSDQKNTEISQTTTEFLPYWTVLPKNTKKQKERCPELGRLLKRRL